MGLLAFSCTNREETKEKIEETTEEIATAPSTERTTPRPSPAAPTSLEEEEQEEKGNSTDLIATIRNDYATTMKLLEDGALREETKEFECDSDPGGGILIRYYNNEILVMIIHELYSEHSWETKSIYLKDAQPFFVFQEEGYWMFGGPLDEETPNTVDNITETRYYLSEGEIIRQLTKSYENKSWEESPESSEIPNEEVKEAKGTAYPLLPAIPQLIAGNVGC